MATPESSATTHPTTPREDRARELATDHHHEIAASREGDTWEVPSCTGAHSYRARYSYTADVEPSCECPDFTYRGLPCKHILAAAIVAAELHRRGGRFIRSADLEEIAELAGIPYPDLSVAFSGERRNIVLGVVKAAIAAEPDADPEAWAQSIRLWAKAADRGQYRAEDPEPPTYGGFLELDYL